MCLVLCQLLLFAARLLCAWWCNGVYFVPAQRPDIKVSAINMPPLKKSKRGKMTYFCTIIAAIVLATVCGMSIFFCAILVVRLTYAIAHLVVDKFLSTNSMAAKHMSLPKSSQPPIGHCQYCDSPEHVTHNCPHTKMLCDKNMYMPKNCHMTKL